MPVTGEKPHASSVAVHEHSEAVVFDFMQPPRPSGVGEGYNTSGPGRVESDLSTKTKTYFAFRVDVWDATGDNLIEHLAGVEDYAMTVAAYWAAIQNRPKDKIT